jgi:DNA polymerase III delta subunit
MLYIFYGTNEREARTKAKALISGLQKKAADAELVRLTDESVTGVDGALLIDHHLQSSGLFKQNYILYLDGMDSVFLGFSGAQLERMKQSTHICVVLLGKLTKKQKDTVEEYADKMVEAVTDKSNSKAQRFDVFKLANALKDRSKPKLWQALAEARLNSEAPEAIVGMLFWAVKDMLVKKQFRNYSEPELKKMIIKLAELPHKARVSAVSIHNALEEFALSSI